MPIAFAIIMGVVGIITWEAWYSIFIFLGIVLHTLGMALKDAQNIRKSILVTSPLVLIYDAFAFSIGGIIYESIAVISSIFGLVRHKEKKQ